MSTPGETPDSLLDQADQHFRANRLDQAAAALVQAAALAPDDPRVLRALGIALVASHRAPDALPALRRLAELRSNDPTTFHQLGDALAFADDLPAAADALRRSVALSPDYGPAWARLGTVLRAQRDDAGALDAFERAAKLEPNPDVLSNLADVLLALLRPDEAVKRLEEALRINPAHLFSRVNLSCAYMRLGEPEPALREIREAVRIAPNFEPAHYYLALALLKRGDLAEGFKQLEWRFRGMGMSSAKMIDQARRRWRGEDLADRTILLHAEQGFGDVIQFARYIPQVTERARDADGAKVIVACHRSLWRLMGSSFPDVAEWIEPPVNPTAIPPGIDCQCPFLSLAAHFGTSGLQTIPANVPYLTPSAELVATWKEKLFAAEGLRVGIAWHGRPTNSLDRYRSCRLSDLEPLLSIPRITFFNLQKDDPGDARMIDQTANLHDWADTAALMMNLDAVISVDSAPLHLAGALGRRTFALLSRGADWRYHLDANTTPWYPTMRLFRQSAVGQWSDVLARVAGELSHLS